VKLFLESSGLGRKITKLLARATVFAQGDPAGDVVYIQEGTVRSNAVSTTGKEAVDAVPGPGDLVGADCLADSHFAWRLRPPPSPRPSS